MSNIKHELTTEAMAAERLLVAFKEQLGDDPEAIADLIEGETRLLEVVDLVLARMALLEDHILALVEHGKKLNNRNSRYKAQHEGLRKALQAALELANCRRVERPTATVAIKRTPATVNILNAADVPAAYLVPQPPKIDNAALKAALNEGPVPGAVLSNGGSTISITRS